jgi:hypothetical protein
MPGELTSGVPIRCAPAAACRGRGRSSGYGGLARLVCDVLSTSASSDDVLEGVEVVEAVEVERFALCMRKGPTVGVSGSGVLGFWK